MQMNKYLGLVMLIVLPSHASAQTGAESAKDNGSDRSGDGALASAIDRELFPCPDLYYAGTLHVATGVLDPASDSPQPAVQQGIIYNNSCKVGGGIVQSALNGSTYIDDGRIPSTTSPSPNTGTLNNYRVNKVQIAYAVRDVTGSPFSIRFRVWDHLLQDASTCTSLAGAGNPIIDYSFTGLPGAPVQGQLTGYILDVDLTGAQFCIHGDADGVFNADAFENGFGYSFTLLGQSGTTPATAGGFFIAGLASSCGVGQGTYFNNPSAAQGTGLDDDPTWYRNGQGGQSSGCFTFGGAATGAAGFWLVMQADLDDCTACSGNPPNCGAPAVSICEPGAGGVINCPCGNMPASAGVGCNNSSNTGGARVTAAGVASLSADTLTFTTIGEKPSATSIVLQGDNLAPSGMPFGQGVSCIAGTLKRLYVEHASSGSITAPQASDRSVHTRSAALGDTITPGTHRYYGVYYRDPSVLGGCPPTSTFNITQQLDVLWGA
jgi:hypothetical protein